MPNTRSAEKRVRVAERRAARNRPVKSAVKTYIRRAQAAIAAGDQAAADQAVGDAVSQLDRAAGKGVIHKNNAARRKSRLMARLNASRSA